MALDDNISALATAIGTKIKEVESSISGGGTQNVFIQEAEPTISVGNSALWIQKRLDGSITFNLIEN